MTEAKPGCIHPDSACGNDLIKLGLVVFVALAAIRLCRGQTS